LGASTVPVIVVAGEPLLAQSVTLHCRPVHASGGIPIMQWPSGVQLFPAPHWLPICVQSASHLPPGEQWKPDGHEFVAPTAGSHVMEQAAGGGLWVSHRLEEGGLLPPQAIVTRVTATATTRARVMSGTVPPSTRSMKFLPVFSAIVPTTCAGVRLRELCRTRRAPDVP
jgi:hypothetical protein